MSYFLLSLLSFTTCFFFFSFACSESWNVRFSVLSSNCCHGLLLFSLWNYRVLLETVIFSFIFMPYILYDHLMNALNSNTWESDSHASFMIFSFNFCSPFHAPGMAWTFFLPLINITFIVSVFTLLSSGKLRDSVANRRACYFWLLVFILCNIQVFSITVE